MVKKRHVSLGVSSLLAKAAADAPDRGSRALGGAGDLSVPMQGFSPPRTPTCFSILTNTT